jgi:hypothetical protein
VRIQRTRWAVVPALAVCALSCRSRFEGGGDLREQRVVLQREVDGIRAIVSRLERGEPMLPLGDVAIAIDDALVRDIIGAQLPFEADVERFHLTLKEAEVHFKGSPVVRLRGSLVVRDRPALGATVTVTGALEDIHVDQASSTLRARVAVDHLGIEKAAGIESVLSGATLDELARTVRLRVKEQLPPIQIPVKVQQSVDLPAVTRGPVRIDGARMPLAVEVSQVVAGQGRLWIAVHFQPGDVMKTKDAPEAGDTSAAEAGVSLGNEDAAGAGAADEGRRK